MICIVCFIGITEIPLLIIIYQFHKNKFMNEKLETFENYEAAVAELTKAKKKFKTVAVTDEEGNILKFAYRKPPLAVIDIAQRKMIETKSQVSYTKVLLKNILHNGYEDILADTSLFVAVMGLTDKMVSEVSASLEGN